MKKTDFLVIGGGIVGLATAYWLLKKRSEASLTLIEKEKDIASHQTGNNSGVIHSGIYYKPASLKAKNCVEGVKLLKEYCQTKNIPFENVGKLILATTTDEIPRLKELERRGLANGVPELKLIEKGQIKEIEPNASGIMALHSPKTAIVNFKQVCTKLKEDIEKQGADVNLSTEVLALKKENDSWIVETNKGTWKTKFLINTSGLYADRIANMANPEISPRQIIPFRGEYYKLAKKSHHLVNGLIYPVPDPKFPFLGVHLTKMIDGSVEAGPNAVLAFSREGYKRGQFNTKDVFDYIRYPGFWQMAFKYWKVGAYELYRSFSKKAFLKSLQRLLPALTESDLVHGGAGVRSQVVKKDGSMVDDFYLIQEKNVIHVLNAPSPAATASLMIGKHIAESALS